MRFFLTRVSVLPARSFRTDRYVSCRGRDRVCRGVGRRADRPSPGTADDSDLSRYAMPLGKRLSSVRTGPVRRACAGSPCNPASLVRTSLSDHTRRYVRPDTSMPYDAWLFVNVYQTCRLNHQCRHLFQILPFAAGYRRVRIPRTASKLCFNGRYLGLSALPKKTFIFFANARFFRGPQGDDVNPNQ